MSIQKGDPIPNARLFVLDESGAPHATPASELFAGKRVVLFAVPGAFTRTCSEKHLPSFVQNADAIKGMPLVRGYVKDPVRELVRPDCERNRQWYHEAELFEPALPT